MTTTGRSVVLYDEDCAFCKWSLEKILAWDRSRRLRAVPIQSEEGERLLAGVDPSLRLDSWHFVSSDGTLFSAGAAVRPLVRVLPLGRPLAMVFGAFPGLTERAYRYVAGRRDRWARLLRLGADRELRRS
ncbi:MAG TPA: DCC1-like thiol-disulfide oxidoreductase family protein [Gaiellaceae bacterium]|nr:DCC1-like thiol-disulfide oxidoreductase family protein [Gaiellaceae bacterium]